MKTKRRVFILLLLPMLLLICTVSSAAEDMPYQFHFDEKPEEAADGAYETYIDGLPPEIRQQVEDAGEAGDAIEKYSVSYFLSLVKNAISDALLPGFKTLSVLMGMVILASVSRMPSSA